MSGMPVNNHTVLLKGVNDSLETMRELMRALLRIKVRPYYLFHCDPVTGAGHFRTSIWKGVEIIEGLRGHVSGLGVPTYVVDGVVHYCVANIPGAVARTSTFALSNCTLPFVLALADHGLRRALGEDEHLRNGLNVHEGMITNRAVADALKLKYTPAEVALQL